MWEALLTLAAYERLTPLLQRALAARDPSAPPAGPPPAVRFRLAQAYTKAYIGHALAFAALAEILHTFSAAGIPTITLKGAALAASVYPDPVCRSLGDLDLLVSSTSVPSALRLLGDLGYTPIPGPASLTPSPHQQGEITLRRTQGVRTQVDLHWALNSRTVLRRAIATPWFWEHTHNVPFPATASFPTAAPPALRIFTPEAQLLHLCAHTIQHGRPRLRWTYDIALLLASGVGGRAFAWDVAIAGAEHNGLALAVRTTLDAVAGLWGVAPPAWVQTELAGIPVSRAERRLCQFSQSGDSAAVAAFDILCQPTPAAAISAARATARTAWFAASQPRRDAATAAPHPAGASAPRRLLHVTRRAARAGWGALRLLTRRPPASPDNLHASRSPVS
jgi:hypothetical protein